ncbi:MAG TPA: ATP-binding protein [Oscillatoriales cyanobacterium M59_W2019_021]|nr:ATP-binding protein [Oscillatoriales cyanobacterium M4454_W2019_049]HIK52356.1 ATP-binding protein [Oscillatoriales cyanobacterium M59_W2019_021]
MHHFLIGLPGSGKSTFAAQLDSLNDESIIISPDRIRAELYGNESIQGNWQEIEAVLISRIQEALNARQTVIYDATNAQRTWRLKFLKKVAVATEEPLQWMAWYLKAPIKICKVWNQQRSRKVPTEVIESMAQALSEFPPHIAEGFAKVVEVDLSKNSLSLADLKREIDGVCYSSGSRNSSTY